MGGLVVIVDDHPLMAETVRVALNGIVPEVRTVPPCRPSLLLEHLLEMGPTLVLLDLDLGPFGSGTRLIAPLTAAGVRVLVVTGETDRSRLGEALESGAIGYLPKTAGLAVLRTTATEALAATMPLERTERAALLEELARDRAGRADAFAPFQRLTEREQATLLALARGWSVHDIARAWVVSEATVRSHVRGVLTKLDAPSQLAAVAAAYRGGWVTPPPDGR